MKRVIWPRAEAWRNGKDTMSETTKTTVATARQTLIGETAGGGTVSVTGDLPTQTPSIPSGLVAVAKAAAVVLGLAAAALVSLPFLPAWVGFLVSALASIAAFLGGQAMPGLKTPGAPLVPVALVPVLMAGSAAVAAVAGHVTGWPAGLLLIISSLLAGAAGKVGPQVVAPK